MKISTEDRGPEVSTSIEYGYTSTTTTKETVPDKKTIDFVPDMVTISETFASTSETIQAPTQSEAISETPQSISISFKLRVTL